jgi:hypothetical protein
MNQKPLLPLYWKCQITGWSIATLYWSDTGFNYVTGKDVGLESIRHANVLLKNRVKTHFKKN